MPVHDLLHSFDFKALRLGQGLGQAPGSLHGRHRGLPLQFLGAGIPPKWPVNRGSRRFSGPDR